MFIIRAAFWLLLVLAFIPVERPGAESHLPVSATDALTAAQSTFHDLAGFCSRNRQACQTGRETARLIGDRAQTGAKAVYHYFSGDEEGSANAALTHTPARDTLSATDRLPEWTGPARDSDNG